ncbi:MAG: UDP-N-acetylglucosamine 1-carboxyvinyltransferase [bacterium]|nr:UDP-N-acetylglucosamine 1-carboxyvinyltransferase [bacterium]
MKTEQAYLEKIGHLIQDSRINRGWTQAELAEKIGSSQSAINRIESGRQNITLEMLARISEELSSEIISVNAQKKTNFRVYGERELSGEIEVKTSKNAAVGLLCASLLNKGKTTLRHVARIEEVNRIIEVLNSIGVKTRWLNEQNDLEITPPSELNFRNMDITAAKRTRSILMFLGPLLHQYSKFEIPFSGGCNLGTRTVEPHLSGLKHFGSSVVAQSDFYEVYNQPQTVEKPIILTERGDTTTENVIMAAALSGQKITIRNASPNYMVQDLCFFLEELGVQVEGIGTTTLTVHGVKKIEKDVEYFVSEDPIEAITFVAVALVTNSEITIKRAPAEFVELELATLENMGANFEISPEYLSLNQRTRLIDIVVKKSTLSAPKDKLHALPFPGINMDNLPFLGLIATMAKGRTLLHDWSYENRAIYFTELSKLNAQIEMVDPHRVYITGPTRWKPADVVAPPALRPSVVVLIAMLAAPGISTLRDVYNINRGYEDFAERLNSLGAQIETITI